MDTILVVDDESNYLTVMETLLGEAGYEVLTAPSAIEAMGDKALAKQRMIAAGVPCAPGYLGADQADATLVAEAKKLGTPLLVKAVAGGGGRGMRLVRHESELQAAIEGAVEQPEGSSHPRQIVPRRKTADDLDHLRFHLAGIANIAQRGKGAVVIHGIH